METEIINVFLFNQMQHLRNMFLDYMVTLKLFVIYENFIFCIIFNGLYSHFCWFNQLKNSYNKF